PGFEARMPAPEIQQTEGRIRRRFLGIVQCGAKHLRESSAQHRTLAATRLAVHDGYARTQHGPGKGQRKALPAGEIGGHPRRKRSKTDEWRTRYAHDEDGGACPSAASSRGPNSLRSALKTTTLRAPHNSLSAGSMSQEIA